MIANPAVPYPGGVPHAFTLNDLRVHNTVADEPSPPSTLSLSSLALAVVLAIGAFIWLDPLRWFTPTEASPPAPAFTPSAEPARPSVRQEIIAPLTPVPATKSVEGPIVPPPVVRAPQVPAPLARPRAASIKPESRSNPKDKTNAAIPETIPKENSAPPMLLTEPEQKTAPPMLSTTPEGKTDAPIVQKLSDETKNAPKPAATNEQPPVTE